MKRFIVLIAFFMFSTAAPGMCNFINSSNNTHDMQMIRQQQFRIQEFNDFNDYQEQKKERLEKEKRAQEKIERAKQTKNNAVQNGNAKFVVEPDGSIRIEK